MTEHQTMTDKILDWFANGERGLSSEAMAFAALGVQTDRKSYPLDTGDFRRCVKLVEAVPEIREHFNTIRSLSDAWRKVTDNWDALTASMEIDQETGQSNTYKIMKKLGL